MAYGRRKKGGQALMDLAKRGGARKRAAKKAKEAAAKEKPVKMSVKKPTLLPRTKTTKAVTPKAAPKKVASKVPARAVTPPLATRKPHGRVIPKDITPGRSTTTSKPIPNRKPHRTPKQRATAKKKLLGEQKTLRKASEGMRHGSEYKGIPGISKKQQDSMTGAMSYGVGGGAGKAIGSKILSKAAPNAVPKLKGMLKDLFKKKATPSKDVSFGAARKVEAQQALPKVSRTGRTTTPKLNTPRGRELNALERNQRLTGTRQATPARSRSTATKVKAGTGGKTPTVSRGASSRASARATAPKPKVKTKPKTKPKATPKVPMLTRQFLMNALRRKKKK
tara:strand:+ start:389 stop:1396 length:1008 start_codon:yes stop_codon:yes gene_type:complete